nr:PLP-dependent aminotransferase family protein [Leucobacter luti]
MFPQLSVDRALRAPLAEQLATAIRDAVLAGRIAPGETLPPTRALSATIGVSRAVVVAAYERLVGEGFLESRQGAGTRVIPDLPGWRTDPGRGARRGRDTGDDRSNSAAVVAPPLAAVTASGPGTAFASGPSSGPGAAAVSGPGIARALAGQAPAGGVIDLRPGRPHAAPAPPRSWVRALGAAAKHPWSPDAPDPRGHVALRRSLAEHARRARGIGCAADDVTVTTGTSEALLLLALALRAVHGRAPRIAVEDPGYRDGSRVLERAGAELVPLAVGADGATGAGLRELGGARPIDAVLLAPSHQFPLGGRIPAAERLAILGWAHESGAIVIEDDYDSEFRHAGALLPAIGSLGGGVATITTLNKVLSPSIRCGAILLGGGDAAGDDDGPGAAGGVGRPGSLAAARLGDELRAVRAELGPALPLPMQLALAEFLESGGFRREVARTRREYRHRRSQLLDQLAAAGVPVHGADGGLHVVIPLGERDGDAVVAALARRGVLVDRVAHYRLEPGADGLIVGYGAESTTRLQRGIAEIAEVLGAVPGP